MAKYRMMNNRDFIKSEDLSFEEVIERIKQMKWKDVVEVTRSD